MPAVGRELEVKIEVAERDLEQLRSAEAGPGQVNPPSTSTLHSVYYDTPDHKLRARGVTLRVRRENGHWLQTVKVGRPIKAGLSSPIEAETALDEAQPVIRDIPDKVLRRRVRSLIGDAPLTAVFETIIDRTQQLVTTEDGSEVEIAFDQGVVRSGRDERQLCEVELELKSGSPDALAGLAQSMFEGRPIELAQQSKADRGYELIGNGRKGAAIEPVPAKLPKLRSSDPASYAMRRIASCVVDQVLGNWHVVLESGDPEGTHQMRVGLRRLRSTLKVLPSAWRGDSLKALDSRLRDLARMLGELRDADVLLADVVGSATPTVELREGCDELKSRLVEKRDGKLAAVREELKAPAWTDLKLRLAILPYALEHLVAGAHRKRRNSITAVANKALARQWRRVSMLGDRIDELDVAHRHELRKELKTLRYVVELFSSLYTAGKVRRVLKRVRAMQDGLGYLNDVALAGRLRTLEASGASPRGAVEQAIGYVIGWHASRSELAWGDAQETWAKLDKARKPWA
jgi:inorganic triphosphatase YgiF